MPTLTATLSAPVFSNTDNQPLATPHLQVLSNQTVLIIGGGMVGLTLALLLAQRSIKSVLLESATYPKLSANPHENYHSSFDARNSALSRRTVQAYQTLGLWDHLAQYATPIHQVRISEEHGFGKAVLDATAEKVESFGQVIENAWLGRVLLAAVQDNSAIQLIDGVEVQQLSQTAQTVSVVAVHAGRTLAFETSIVVAADGRDSFCRKALGVTADVRPYNQVALVATVETSKPHQHIAFERFTTTGPVALLPLPDGTLQAQSHRRSVVWTVAAGEEVQWIGSQNDQKFIDALQVSFGGRAGAFVRTSARASYPLMQVLAEKQAVGRVVLLGNAAHTLHPVAGQGFNLCMRDALVLTDLLAKQASTQADLGDSTQLLAYEASRLKDQKRVITFCDSVVRGFSNPNILLKLLRNTGLLAFDVIPGVKQLVANYAMGLKS